MIPWGNVVAGFFSKRFFWSPYFRVPGFAAFGLLVAALVYRASGSISISQLAQQAAAGEWLSEKFAFSLAWLLGASAAGLLVAFAVFDWLLVVAALKDAREVVEGVPTKADFSAHYPRLSARLAEHPLARNAWIGFSGSCIEDARGVRGTQRPQAYFNLAALRDRLPSLKMMPGVPGYFVGIGLLLTFIGLVMALSKAGEATASAHRPAQQTSRAAPSSGDAATQGMDDALTELLTAAKFKFSTSIAGLAASILLSLLFRFFVIAVESSLARLCEALEEKVDYLAPQKVTLEMLGALDAQLAELKAINSEEFFSRLGQDIASPMQQAMHLAVEPLTQKMSEAVGEIKSGGQSGLEQLIARFSESVQGGAGMELRELAASLKSIQAALEETRRGISGTGEDFSRRLSEAAENLNRVATDVGRSLGDTSQQSRESLAQMLAALQATFEAANRKVEENLAQSATGASERLESAMGRVLGRLERQVEGLGAAMGGVQESAAGFLGEAQRQVAETQTQSVETIARASAEAAAALRAGLAQAMAEIRRDVETFSAALRASEASLGAQRQALDAVALRSREAADLVGQSAQAMRAAAEPVARSNEKLAGAALGMTAALDRSVESLDSGQKAAAALAQALSAQSERVAESWRAYEERFGKVDQDLERAFAVLAAETQKQAELLSRHTVEIDKGLAKSVDHLARFIEDFGGGAEELRDAVEDLKSLLANRANQKTLTGAG